MRPSSSAAMKLDSSPTRNSPVSAPLVLRRTTVRAPFLISKSSVVAVVTFTCG